MVTGFTFLSRLTQIAPPSTRFVFLGAEVRLGLPSHPASRRRSCLRLGVSTTSSSRGLPPPIDRPCRAYSRRSLRRRADGSAWSFNWNSPAHTSATNRCLRRLLSGARIRLARSGGRLLPILLGSILPAQRSPVRGGSVPGALVLVERLMVRLSGELGARGC